MIRDAKKYQKIIVNILIANVKLKILMESQKYYLFSRNEEYSNSNEQSKQNGYIY